jgi:hypothetical protein
VAAQTVPADSKKPACTRQHGSLQGGSKCSCKGPPLWGPLSASKKQEQHLNRQLAEAAAEQLLHAAHGSPPFFSLEWSDFQTHKPANIEAIALLVARRKAVEAVSESVWLQIARDRRLCVCKKACRMFLLWYQAHTDDVEPILAFLAGPGVCNRQGCKKGPSSMSTLNLWTCIDSYPSMVQQAAPWVTGQLPV